MSGTGNKVANKNKRVIVLTAVCLVLFIVAVGLCVGAKLSQPDSVEGGASYKIIVNDNIIAYDGDGQMLTPRIVDSNGTLVSGRFTYAVVNEASAPITVDASGVVSVKQNGESNDAEIEITELNTQTKTVVRVTVVRKLSGIKGVVFGDDLVVATQKQELTLGDEYTVTVKTIPANAVLQNDQLSIKTVDKYGKEVQGVLDYSVVPNTNKIKIRPVGLGSGTMVFSVTADGKELCKDEQYQFGISMKSAALNGEIVTQIKRRMTDDVVERDKIELISSSELALQTSFELTDGVDTLFGVNKTYFPSLDTVVFASSRIMTLNDEAVNTDICYRVNKTVYESYAQDEYWKQFIYSVLPYDKNAAEEKWVVYHYYEAPFDGSEPLVKIVNIDDDFALEKLDGRGCSNDYYYIGKDPKPTSQEDKDVLNASVLKRITDADKNGLHVNVGYTPNTYQVKYIIEQTTNDGDKQNVEVVDSRTWTYGAKMNLYSAEDLKAAGIEVYKTGHTLFGWLLDKAKPDDVLAIEDAQCNLTVGDTVEVYAAWKPIEYTVKFIDANLENISAVYGETIILPVPTKVGQIFDNYTDADGNVYKNGAHRNLMSERGTIELTAHYHIVTYRVLFDKNGGSWKNDGQDEVWLTYNGQPYELRALNPPTGKDSYEWMIVDENGRSIEGTSFSANDSLVNLTLIDEDTVRLKAFWNPIKYNIVYSFANFTYTYRDKENKTQTVNGTYTQSRIYDDNAPLIAPTRTGYTALEWTVNYYTEEGSTVQHKLTNVKYKVGDKSGLITGKQEEKGRTYYLSLNYKANTYTVTFNYNGATTTGDSTSTVTYDQAYGELPFPKKLLTENSEEVGYRFDGWYDNDKFNGNPVTSDTTVKITNEQTLYAKWTAQPLSVTITDDPNDLSGIGSSEKVTVKVSGGSGQYTYSPTSGSGTGYKWTFDSQTGYLTVEVSKKDIDGTIKIAVEDNVYSSTATISKKWSSSESCVAEGTLITLADGTQKPVEQLTGDEMLLVWNFLTGTFDSAPILCIDSDPAAVYKVINLHFSDGTVVKVISEHGFWDVTLNKYVYLDEDAAQYVGHLFSKQTYVNGAMVNTEVRLTDVVITNEYTTAWSPVTYEYMCIYVDGMLSLPGGINGLFNIFEVDPDTMTYDREAMARDIETYGLYTYEELSQLIPIPEELFEAVQCQYLKVAVGKGLTTVDELRGLFERYADLLVG